MTLMALINWHTGFETGILSVDVEHREMLKLLNDLHNELCRDPKSNGVIFFLGEVYANIVAQFALEEKIMREIAYDDYRTHKDQHERLLGDIRKIIDDHRGRGYGGAPHLLADLLKDWFEEHFHVYDARLALVSEGRPIS